MRSFLSAKEQTLNVPVGTDLDSLEGFELDDNTMEKLAAIHTSLGNMLKIRDKSPVMNIERTSEILRSF